MLERAYGMASRERNFPNTINTRFSAGSVAKQFTAAAILRLEMDGKLSTSDPIRNYLGDFPGAKNGITIEQLLTHTSGVIRPGAAFVTQSRDEFVDRMKETPEDSPPGTKFLFSNGGYGLLGAVIEKVSGETYEEYVREKLFVPAGMACTDFLDDPASGEFRATGYEDARAWPVALLGNYWLRSASDLTSSFLSADDGAWPVSQGPYDWSAHGAANVVTTVGDLWKWEQAMRNGSILVPAAKEKLFTPRVVVPKSDDSYAYGWFVSPTRRGTTLIHHEGNLPGFQAMYMRYPDDGLTFFVLSNVRPGHGRVTWRDAFRNGIEPIVFRERRPVLAGWVAPIFLLLIGIALVTGFRGRPRPHSRAAQPAPQPQEAVAAPQRRSATGD